MLEYWEDRSEPHYSTPPLLQFALPEHLPKLFAPTRKLFVVGQPHNNDLIVLYVLFELVVRFRIKNIFAKIAEDALGFRPNEEIGEQPRRIRMGRLAIDRDETQRRQVFIHAHIFDGTGILIFVFDVPNGDLDLA